jgi:hypothetical protein
VSLVERDPAECGVKGCRGRRLEGRWVCAEHAPMMDRIRAEIAAEQRGGRVVRRTRVKRPGDAKGDSFSR